MSKFYFHTDGLEDRDGLELKSVQAAKCEAMKLAGLIVCDEVTDIWENAEWTVTVTDERHLTVFELRVLGTDAPATAPAERQSSGPSVQERTCDTQ